MEVAEKEPLVGTAMTRSILRRYMADYTTSTSAPAKLKGGFYAVLMKDTGEVWLGETSNFAMTLGRVRSKANIAHCVDEAIKRGSELEIWLLTQPQRFSAQQLENELYEANLLSFRKVRDVTGPGKLYCIRHDYSHDYFVTAERKNRTPQAILSAWYRGAMKMKASGRNQAMSDFISKNAGDILNERGFSITFIDKFDNRDDEWLKRQCYIDDCKYGNNLNFVAVD